MAITSSRGERTATSFCDFGNACCNFSRSRCVTPFRLAHTGEMNFEGLLFARANRPQGDSMCSSLTDPYLFDFGPRTRRALCPKPVAGFSSTQANCELCSPSITSK